MDVAVGIAQFNGSESLSDMARRADEHMYAMKERATARAAYV